MDLILLPDEELRNRFRKVGFNPYFNGSNTSTILRNYSFLFLLQCFNPYFNGSNTSTLYCHNYHNHNLSCFNPYFNGSNTSTVFCR